MIDILTGKHRRINDFSFTVGEGFITVQAVGQNGRLTIPKTINVTDVDSVIVARMAGEFGVTDGYVLYTESGTRYSFKPIGGKYISIKRIDMENRILEYDLISLIRNSYL